MSVARRRYPSYTFPSQLLLWLPRKKEKKNTEKILDHGIMNISHGRGHLWRDECQTECRSSEAAFSNCPSDKMPQPASVTDVNRRNRKRRGNNTGTRVYACMCACVCVCYMVYSVRYVEKINQIFSSISSNMKMHFQNALNKP